MFAGHAAVCCLYVWVFGCLRVLAWLPRSPYLAQHQVGEQLLRTLLVYIFGILFGAVAAVHHTH
jgi:hypothetical protein